MDTSNWTYNYENEKCGNNTAKLFVVSEKYILELEAKFRQGMNGSKSKTI